MTQHQLRACAVNNAKAVTYPQPVHLELDGHFQSVMEERARLDVPVTMWNLTKFMMDPQLPASYDEPAFSWLNPRNSK